MCGIVGLLLRDAPCDTGALTRMRDLVQHRGPDDAGNHLDGVVGLGHRRLSIIDLGTGHQPMSTADGRYTIVFNGEIYNYRQLRAQLESQGVRFRTSSDTEVILELHALRGATSVTALNGMFAYAIWDRDARTLFLARDRAGIKPLYYVNGRRGFAFGSEIKSLFESGLVSPELDASHVAEYLLFRHVAGPRNLFRDVLALPPGHTMTVTEAETSAPASFWSLPDPFPTAPIGYAEAIDALDAALTDAVGRQMIADVPLGTFCSGGIDSSLVTAIAARLAGRPINTFSVGFAESGYDESAFARMGSAACGTVHHEIRLDEARFAELLPRLVWHNDLPLNYANSVHIFAVSELARRHVKVVLTGEGADELFGGYPRYAVPQLVAALGRIPQTMRAPLAAMLRAAPDHRLRRIGAMAGRPLEDAIVFNATTIEPRLVEELVAGLEALPDFEFRRSRARSRTAGRSAFETAARLDFEAYLLSILNRQDKMSMATSLESRVPFLDNVVIDLAQSLPQTCKQTLRHRKRVLKDVARRYLPHAIVDRRKSGFGVPLREWFRGKGSVATLFDNVVAGGALTGLLDSAVLERLVREHHSGLHDHSDLLWGILNLGLWRDAFRC
jgi:asparagine synthase (glutamine-hydrolysing)